MPVASVRSGIGRSFGVAGDPEQESEGIEGVVAPVESEDELVEVGLAAAYGCRTF